MTGNDTQRRYAGINKAYDTFTDILYKDSRMLCGQDGEFDGSFNTNS